MASTGYIHPFIQERLNELSKPSVVCLFTHGVGLYDEINRTLQAAGHDTTELHAAITETLESIVKLRAARDKAVERFKQQGILFTVVAVAKEEEAPAVQDATEHQ